MSKLRTVLFFIMSLQPLACGADKQSSPTPAAPVTPAAEPAGTASLTGTVSGQPLTPRSAVFVAGEVNDVPVVVLRITDDANDCALLTQGRRSGKSSGLIWVLAADESGVDASTRRLIAPAAGSYSVVTAAQSGNTVEGFYSQLDATCQQTLPDSATAFASGSVSLTLLKADQATGTFQLSVGTQADSLTGSFDAQVCPALLDVTRGTTRLTCN